MMNCNANPRLLLLYLLVFYISLSSGSKVLELSDRFLDVRENGMWLVKFYAPWCGHCRRLEATWNLIAQDLHYSNVRVGRLDCTRFNSVASEFDIRGFPTILFFKGQKIFVYNGDRTRDDMVKFALRLEGVPIQQLNSIEELNTKTQKHEVLFLLVAKSTDDTSLLRNAYNYVAEQFQASSYFFSFFSDSIAVEKSPLNSLLGGTGSTEGVYVFKDDSVYNFKETFDDIAKLNASLKQWVQLERFPQFNKITQSTFSLMMQTGKYLVIAIMEENLLEKLTPEMEEFRRIIKSVAREHSEEFKERFLFGWSPQPSIGNSVAMQNLEAPSLLVVNSLTYQYYTPNVAPSETTPEIIVGFLKGILDNTERARGGNGIFNRLYRVYFDATTTLVDMWIGNPVLTSVLFGLPLGFLSLICYSICCADILDANDEDESRDDDESHEKQE